ncbi:hypothetical protein D3C81_1882520 [compost metagenome]
MHLARLLYEFPFNYSANVPFEGYYHVCIPIAHWNLSLDSDAFFLVVIETG